MGSSQLLSSIDVLQSLAGLCELAGQSKKSAFLFKAIEEAEGYWRAGLQLQCLATAEKTGEANTYIDKVLSSDKLS